MSVNLSKSQKISFAKKSQGLQQVFVGLGWKPAQASSGFFKSMFSTPDAIDLDASCIVFDAQKNVIDTVWFRQLRNSNNSIVHTGDNRTGEGDGDDEVIKLDLSKLPENAAQLVFVINSFTGQTFDKVGNAYCRLVDQVTGKEIAQYKLTGEGKHTAQIMARLYIENGEWMMQALGEPANAQVVSQLESAVRRFI